MSEGEHEEALTGLAARGWPASVIDHMRDDPIGPYVLRLPEVAKRLGISRSTVHKMAKDGRLPAFTEQPPYRDQKAAVLVGIRALERWIDGS
jgi:hypothetical protein